MKLHLPGGNINASWLGAPTPADPWYQAVASPLLRWAREWWLLGGFSHQPPKDICTAKELAQAFRVVQTPLASERKDPMGAIASSLQALGWTAKAANIWTDECKQDMHLMEGSPAHLASLIERAFEKIRDNKLVEACLHRAPEGSCPFDSQVLRMLLRSKASKKHHRATEEGAIAGGGRMVPNTNHPASMGIWCAV